MHMHIIPNSPSNSAFVIPGMLIFSTMIFHAQITVDDEFETVPSGLWWSIITMTTVGYGDMVPTTTMGRYKFHYIKVQLTVPNSSTT